DREQQSSLAQFSPAAIEYNRAEVFAMR
ncbi:hypothetical protein EVA_02587, partial [gut metagenome]